MPLHGEKPRSLIEQKRMQWAKEREELARLSVPWGRVYSKFDKNSVRAKTLSKFSNSELALNRDESFPSRNLPPITRNKSYDRYEVEGDTSGYASDSAKEGTPEYYINKKQEYPQWNWNQRSSESESPNGRDERPKWGDRGLAVGHLWDPHELNEQFGKPVEPPGWMQRGLQGDKEVLVVNNSSPDESVERPCTGESAVTNMKSMRTYLRGQNIPLEPGEAAERERKRQKAVELQNAIKQQLEEREIKRKLEREKKLREEAEEESRIRKEQEIERLRVEEEHKMIIEKKEREKKRNQAMQEALENAEKSAKLEKSRQKYMRMKNNVLNFVEEEPEIAKKDTKPVQSVAPSPIVPSPTNLSPANPEMASPVNSNNIVNNNTVTSQDDNTTVSEFQREQKHSPYEEHSQNKIVDHQDNHVKLKDSLSSENLTLVLQSPFESLQGMQLALLVPTMNVPNTVPVALPMPLPLNGDRTPITENRVLTPSIYRMRRSLRESSTQTESSYFNYGHASSQESLKGENYNLRGDNYRREEKYGSLDRRRDSNVSDRRERRLRSEERSKDNRAERPKWGANKPPTRYLKQSEKDPVYQKRKLRQKSRESKGYEDKNNNYSQSSDDSVPHTPDHRVYRKQSYNRNMWHKNERILSQNISVYQTEIVPLEMDRQGRLYVKDRTTDYREVQSERVCTRQKYRDSTPESSRRSDRFTPRTNVRKERLNERNERKKLSDKDDDSFDKEENEGILDKLTNLRHGLLLKQQEWDESKARRRSSVEFPNVHDNP